ncbi:hypothetical protein [Nitratireductor sp. OM-1]|uniref:hypothetical protein n=1 Tax=Nitratireductor sp. OM-1 TaxID=1756988 RepID=UPI000DDD2B09|nr:hypothetical protein [Nitratireductor sp. OM-1]
MQFFGHDLSFWAAVFGAALFKLATSPRLTWLRSLISVFAALFAAWVFTRPVLAFLNLDGDTYTIAVAVLAGLTGEGLMKWSIFAANNPKEAIEFLKVWRHPR